MENSNAMVRGMLAIWDFYGAKRQSRQLVEEAYELAEAVTDRRTGEVADDHHIVEELADVQLMLDQVREAYGIDQDAVMLVKANKISRQLGRMREEQEAAR